MTERFIPAPGVSRRSLLGMAALTGAIGGLGVGATLVKALTAPSFVPWGPLHHIDAGDLNIAYADIGPRHGPPVILLHGWPYDIHSFVQVTPYLTKAGYRVIIPYLRGYGATRFRSVATVRNGQQAAFAIDILALMDALKIPKAILAGFDWGARAANVVAALWPDRVRAMVSVSGYLIGSQKANEVPLAPEAELSWWYQFYFATERGRLGYERHRRDFARLIWRSASPRSTFDEAIFARSAPAFDNPDHVAIVIDNYRWRLGLTPGEARYDALEQRLAVMPSIAVPTVTLEGDANGAPHPDPASYVARFTGRYAHHLVTSGIGHDLPREAPRAFADAVMEAAALV